MENIKQEKNIFELFKTLVDLECNNAKVEAVIFAKKGSRLVANKVNDMHECIVENAKEYGKKIEFVNETQKIKSAIEANILRNYTLSLEKVNKQFDNKRKSIVGEKMRWEARRTVSAIQLDVISKMRDEAKKAPEYLREKTLQEQAKKAIDEGDYEKLSKINFELTEISKRNPATKLEAHSRELRAELALIEETLQMCEKEIKNCEIERRNSIELIAGKKENLLQTANKKYLLVLKNEGWLQKTWGKILNKLNGSKRYTENVTNVLSKKVRDIDYKTIPALKMKLQAETVTIMEKTKEAAKGIKYSEVKENKSAKVVKYTIKSAKTVSNKTKYVTEQGKKLTQNIINKTGRAGTKITAQAWQNANKGYNAMIGQARSAKMWTISKMEQRINVLEQKQTPQLHPKQEQQELAAQ